MKHDDENNQDEANVLFRIELPKASMRNPLGHAQERRQIMRDRRNRRPKDARRKRAEFDY